MRFKNEQLEMANEALRNIVDLQDEMILQDTEERNLGSLGKRNNGIALS